MIFDNSGIRRQDRALDELSARTLLEKAEYGVLSMVDNGNVPYAVPVNFVYDGKSSIYIHSALEGHKLNALAHSCEAAFVIVGRTQVLPSQFTTNYESVIISGKARVGLSEEERRHAFRLILEKYSPEDLAVGLKYVENSLHRTEIIRIDIRTFSGKARRSSAEK